MQQILAHDATNRTTPADRARVEGQPMKLPVKRIAVAKHVGTLDASAKRRDSMEGAGLSVSLHPDEWREIARGLVSGPTWDCRRSDGAKGAFLDVLRLKGAHLAAIEDWAIREGLARRAEIYFMSYEDEELEDTVTWLFETEAEMLAEAEDRDDAETGTQPGLVATEALRAISMGRVDLACVPDMIAIAYAERETDLDGCWWSERLDPDVLSAPRGVIVPARIPRWAFSPAA